MSKTCSECGVSISNHHEVMLRDDGFLVIWYENHKKVYLGSSGRRKCVTLDSEIVRTIKKALQKPKEWIKKEDEGK